MEIAAWMLSVSSSILMVVAVFNLPPIISDMIDDPLEEEGVEPSWEQGKGQESVRLYKM